MFPDLRKLNRKLDDMIKASEIHVAALEKNTEAVKENTKELRGGR